MANVSVDSIGELVRGLFTNSDAMKGFLQSLVNVVMREEVTRHLGAAGHERTADRKGYRNGTKSRQMNTRAGQLELDVPQVRDCQPYHPSMFAKWQRSERALMTACAEMYFQGVSTRNVQDILNKMCGGEISSSTVSRVAAELDEKLETFRRRRLDATDYPYLQIDARYEKVRVEGRVVSQAVLVTVGFTALGQRELLDWRVGDSESQDTWGEVFRSLKDRGLRGVRLVVSDAHSGIVAAMQRHFQGVAWQRCRVHFKREIAAKVSYKACREVLHDLASVFEAWERVECLRRSEEMATKWEGRYPKVAAMLRSGLEDCLTVLDYPQTHRRRLSSTNMMERLMRRLKARTRVVGVFPNRASCDRLIGALLLEVNDEWAVESKPYYNMKTEAAGVVLAAGAAA